MLNDLRNQATFEPGEEDQPEASQPEPPKPLKPLKPPKPPKPHRSFDRITGTTDKQRLMLAVLLLVMVCLLGVVLLVITGKVVPPVSF